MKILITGTTGFLGSRLYQILDTSGHQLITLNRSLPFVSSSQHLHLTWDDFFSLPMTHHWKDLEAVIHLAGAPLFQQRWTEKFKKTLYDSRISFTEIFFNQLISSLNCHPTVWLNASAIGYYGHRPHELLDENSPPGKGFLATLCQDWENHFFKLPHLKPMRKIALRTGLVLDQQGSLWKKLKQPFTYGCALTFGTGDQWMSWIHREDLIRIILQCLHHQDLTGPINACTPHPILHQEWVNLLAKKFHTKVHFKISEKLLKLILGEFAEVLLTSQKVYPSQLEKTQFEFLYPTMTQTLNILEKIQ